MELNPESKANVDKQELFFCQKFADQKRCVAERVFVMMEEAIGPFFWTLVPQIISQT